MCQKDDASVYVCVSWFASIFQLLSLELPSPWKAPPSTTRTAAWVSSVAPRSTEHARVPNQRSCPLFHIETHVSEKLWCQGKIKSWADWPSSLAAWWCSRTRPRTARLIALRPSLDGWCSTDNLCLGRSILGQRCDMKMLNAVPVGFVPSLHQHNNMELSVHGWEKYRIKPYQAPDILSTCSLKKLEPNLSGMVVASFKPGERRRLSRVIAPMQALVHPWLQMHKPRQPIGGYKRSKQG